MDDDGYTLHLSGDLADATLLYGNGEEHGPQMIFAALLRLLKFAIDKPSKYALAREILTIALFLPQECKGGFLNELAGLLEDQTGEPSEWRAFRNKLQTEILKAQGIVQKMATLLEDWHIDQPAVKQMELFTRSQKKTEAVDMTTGEVLSDAT